MAKDINIHTKVLNAEQAQQQLNGIGESAHRVGQKTASGQKQASDALGQTTQRMSGMGRVLGNLKGQVLSFVGAWLGLQGVQKLVNWLIAKLERIQQLQKDIYEKSLSLAEVGQALEIQTGTVGKQQFWGRQAVDVQKAGGLTSPQAAQQMLISMDIAFGQQGGIKSPEVRELAKQLAPFFGAAGIGGEGIAKTFEFAGTAGIAPTADAYMDYFSKLMAGYTSSKATDFGQFMIALQKGGTAYMTGGGTLEEAISVFAGARSVMSNEALAATLMEQTARLSGGAYEKPRQAIEKALGLRWSDLSMDQRTQALLQYVAELPEGSRIETLGAQGFPVELATQMGKMVTPEAMRTMTATRQRVTSATTENIEEQINAYIESILGKSRIGEAERSGIDLEMGHGFADWQERAMTARKEHEKLLTRGDDRRILDRLEPSVMALEEIRDEIRESKGGVPRDHDDPMAQLYWDIAREIDLMSNWPGVLYPKARGGIQGQRFTERLQSLQQSAPVIVNDNSMHFHPTRESDERGSRFTQD